MSVDFLTIDIALLIEEALELLGIAVEPMCPRSTTLTASPSLCISFGLFISLRPGVTIWAGSMFYRKLLKMGNF